MLVYRIISAVIGIPLLLTIFWIGKLPLLALVAILIIIGCKELNNILIKQDINPSLGLGVINSLFLLFTAYFNNTIDLGFAFVLLIILNLTLMVYKFPNFNLKNSAGTVFMVVYIGWLFTHLYLLRVLHNGWYLIVLLLVTTWSTDTFAYFIGKKFGRNKLAPAISPKKTIEGSFGGVIGSVIGSGLVYLIYSSGEINLFHYLVIGLLVGISAQIGDLAESALKRLGGVKDSGNIIPGHGGVLDRFDSMLFTAPLLFYYVKLIVF